MQRRHVSLSLVTALTAAAMLAPGTNVKAETWIESVPGTYNWLDTLNWQSDLVPNAVGATANFTLDFSATTADTMTVLVPGGDGVTVGVLNIGDSGPSPDSIWRIGNNGAGTLIFNNGDQPAQINSAKDLVDIVNGHDFIGANLTLNSNLIITVAAPAGNQLRISGSISGTGGITKEGAGWVELTSQSGSPNTYTGPTIINGGRIRYSGGSIDLIVGDVIVNNGSTLQNSQGNNNGISDTANINLANGFFNPGGASDTIGSLEGENQNSQAGGGSGTITYGANNLDKTYNGTLQSSTSWVKVGTGTQTFGGNDQSAQSSGTRNFHVLGGKVFLNKPAGVTSVAQTNLMVGDGSQSGATRPELRLLTSNQIQVHAYLAAPAETTQLTLNSGIFNSNGQDETLGTGRTDSAAVILQGTSTLDLGAGDSVLVFGNSSAASWAGTLEVLNWSGSTAGAGTDQVFFGTDATGLSAAQLGMITFVNPDGQAAGSYAATLLATGELIPVVSAAPIPGDADGDGDVDLDDIAIWAANFTGSLTPGTGPGTHATGDWDTDKDVDLDDQAIWASGFTGSLAPSALAAIPEPASFALCSLALIPFARRRRDRR